MPYFLRTHTLIVVGVALGVVCIYLASLFLPNIFSRGTETPEEGVIVTYNVPTSEEVEVATSYDAFVPQDQLVEEPVNIPMPLSVVSQAYITDFNKLVNQGILIEEQLKVNVAPAMNAVQKEAAAGNFLKMFEFMVAAREQLAILDGIANDFNSSLTAYRATYATPQVAASVRTSSEALDTAAVTLHKEVVQFSALMKKSVDGTVPSQQLITDTEASNRRVVEAATNFNTSITAIGEVIKQNVQ